MTAVPPAGGVSSDDKTWSLIAWLGGLFGCLGFLVPLIVMMTKGKESDFVRRNATEALNFNLTVLIAYIISAVLVFAAIGSILVLAVFAVHIVFCIIGAIKVYGGEEYRCPVNIRMVK